MDLNLKGKVAIVTGGAQGIGRAIAATLIQEGAIVVIADIGGERAREAATTLSRNGRTCVARTVDVTKRAQVDELVSGAQSEFGQMDILINNAGMATLTPIEEMTDEI